MSGRATWRCVEWQLLQPLSEVHKRCLSAPAWCLCRSNPEPDHAQGDLELYWKNKLLRPLSELLKPCLPPGDVQARAAHPCLLHSLRKTLTQRL